MRILVAGATGAIGSKLVPLLVEAGHEVTGTSRTGEGASGLAKLGATPAVMDALDPVSTSAAVSQARPDLVVHQLTALPKKPNFRDPEIYAATNRLRREGTANLIAAAKDAGVRRMVAQSIAFAYSPEGSAIKSEDSPLATDAPEPFGETVRTIAELERLVTETEGLAGTVLRYGWFYGPNTYFARDGFIAGEVLARRYPLVGSAKGISSFIHTEDAAAATAAAVGSEATGIFNVVDDEPMALAEWLPLYAETLGAKRPMRVPKLVARLAAGPVVSGMATGMRGASNAKAKAELGWEPSRPSVRVGFGELGA